MECPCAQMDPNDPNPWKWDAARKKYYRYDARETCYIYADGERLALSGEAQGCVKPVHEANDR